MSLKFTLPSTIVFNGETPSRSGDLASNYFLFNTTQTNLQHFSSTHGTKKTSNLRLCNIKTS